MPAATTDSHDSGLDCLQDLRAQLDEIGHRVRADNDDISFLKGFLEDPVIQKISQTDELKVQLSNPPSDNRAEKLLADVSNVIQKVVGTRDGRDLDEILSDPHIGALMKAYDDVADKNYEEDLFETNRLAQPPPPVFNAVNDQVRLVSIKKDKTTSLGITVKIDENYNLRIARVLAGSVIDKQGMLHVGDIIKEVNGIPVATPEQLMDIIRVADTEITFKIIPTLQDNAFKSQVNLSDQILQSLQVNPRDLEEDYEDETDKLRNQLEADKTQIQTAKDKEIEKMRKEIEFLQGSFASYKTTVHLDQDEKWKKREHDMTMLAEEKVQGAVHEIRTKMIQERNSERITHQKEHQKNIDSLRKEHKKELDALVRRFSNVAADLERLKKTTAELKEVKTELEEVRSSYNETCKLLATTTRDLADTKVKLLSFEDQFEQKVQQVDDKYKDQINSLMTKNVELRRLYTKKCGELYDEKVSADMERVVRVSSAKEVMHNMLKSKHKAEVSLTPGDILTEEEKSVQTIKHRRSSAPITQKEAEIAFHMSGKLENPDEDEDEFILPDLNIPETKEEIEKMRRELLGDLNQSDLEEDETDDLI